MLATKLEPKRWQVGVFCLGQPGPLVQQIQAANIHCECLEVDRRNPVQAIARLAVRLRRFKPELVQSFLFHANLATRLAAPLARLALGIGWLAGRCTARSSGIWCWTV